MEAFPIHSICIIRITRISSSIALPFIGTDRLLYVGDDFVQTDVERAL
jgi:hypothetical protein